MAGEWKGWQRGKGMVGERKRWRRGEAMVASGGNGKRWRASGSDTEGKGCPGGGGGRAERAVPRRGTIVVSPTQLVPEVLAVWGSD